MVPSIGVMPRDGSLALAFFGRMRKVQEPPFSLSAGRKSFALKRIFFIVVVARPSLEYPSLSILQVGTFFQNVRLSAGAINEASDGSESHPYLETVVTPHGPLPTLIRFNSLRVFTSTTDTSSDAPLAEYNFEPSGLSAIPHTRVPTGTVALTAFLVVSITATVFLRPVETKSSFPSLDIAVPIGNEPSGSWIFGDLFVRSRVDHGD